MNQASGEHPYRAREARSASSYENQVIGRFLVDLGFEAGKSGDEEAPIVDLLQQTPLDSFLADALINNLASLFMIEFKRQPESVEREQKKWREGFKQYINTRPDYFTHFAHAHVIAFGSASGRTVAAASYVQEVFGAVEADPIENLAEHVRNPANGASTEKMLEYISIITPFRHAYDEGEGDGGGPAVIAIAELNGKKQCFSVPIATLSLDLARILGLNRDIPTPQPKPTRETPGMSP